MSLLTPLSETDPEGWTLRFLAHFVVGLVAWHSLIWTFPPGHMAWAVPLAYLLVWEVAAQRVGAGWWDAAADASAASLGSAVGFELVWLFGGWESLWQPITAPAWPFLTILATMASAITWGVWKRDT